MSVNVHKEIDRVLMKYLVEPREVGSEIRDMWLANLHKKPAIKFSVEFFQKDEIPLQVLKVLDESSDEGYLWRTNQRVFFCCPVKDNIFSKPRPYYAHFSYRVLETVEFKKGLISHKIILRVRTDRADGTLKAVSYESTERPMAELFVSETRNKIGKLVESPSNRTPTQNLKYIKEMLDAGLITQVEYDAKKAEILASM